MDTPPGTRPVGQGTAVALRDLREEARTLSPEAFADRHGQAFLILTAATLCLPKGPASTDVRLLDDDEPRGDSTASLSLVAYPVRRTERSEGHLITVGRASMNDVVIPDISISRFHAFVKELGDGRFAIQEVGSTNGTTLNGRSVPRQGSGAPMELKSGDSVRMGQVSLTFLDAEALRSFVTQLER